MGHKKNRKPHYGSFVMLGRDMLLRCQEWKRLSPPAKLVYIYLRAKHNGINNGEICLYYSELKAVRGISAPSTVSKAFKELENQDWIRRTNLGGLYRRRNEYELTGKYDRHISDSRPLDWGDKKKTAVPAAPEHPLRFQEPNNAKRLPAEVPPPSQARTPEIVDSLSKYKS